jgi:hypothetical protein
MGVAQWPLSKTYAPTPATINERVINIIFIFFFIFVPPVEFRVNLGTLHFIRLACNFIRANHMPISERKKRLMDNTLNKLQ